MSEDRETSINEIADITDGYNMSELQRQCPDFIPTFDYIENGTLPEDDKAARKLIFESEQFVIDDGILYHIFHPRTKRLHQIFPVVKQLCIPRSLREQLVISYHDDNCHIGQERLYNSLKMRYWFRLMYSSVL